MLRLTLTFIVTSIAKSSDKTQGRPGRKNHATAATALKNSELSAEPNVGSQFRNFPAVGKLARAAADGRSRSNSEDDNLSYTVWLDKLRP
jgi:hypothetical protein